MADIKISNIQRWIKDIPDNSMFVASIPQTNNDVTTYTTQSLFASDIAKYVSSYIGTIDNQIVKLVEALPDTGSDNFDSTSYLNKIVVVPNESESGNNLYDEYYLKDENGKYYFELLGASSVNFDATEYLKTSEAYIKDGYVYISGEKFEHQSLDGYLNEGNFNSYFNNSFNSYFGSYFGSYFEEFFGSYISNTDIATQSYLAEYVKIEDNTIYVGDNNIVIDFSNYVTSDTLNDYVTKTYLGEYISVEKDSDNKKITIKYNNDDYIAVTEAYVTSYVSNAIGSLSGEAIGIESGNGISLSSTESGEDNKTLTKISVDVADNSYLTFTGATEDAKQLSVDIDLLAKYITENILSSYKDKIESLESKLAYYDTRFGYPKTGTPSAENDWTVNFLRIDPYEIEEDKE